MRSLRSAAALLRGATGLALAPQRVLAAGAGAQAAAELACRLGQGCAARHAATAAGDESGVPLRGAATDVSVAPRRRAPYPQRGEKTADGKPKPDERTVADLVERRWFKTEEAAVTLLTRRKTGTNRFAFETAKAAADWLEATLGLEPLKGGVLPAAKAIRLEPLLLCRDAAALQRQWEALTLPAEQGGTGIAFSEEQALEAVLKQPRVLGNTTDRLKRGWLMLTATEGGLGLSPDDARDCILRSPAVLCYDHDHVVRRVELLRSLGYAEAHKMVLKEPRVLNYKEETVRDHDAWWKQTGLDHVKILETNPGLLGACSKPELQARLDFLSGVVGMSTADLNNAPALFHRSLDGALRARYFYARLKGRLGRYGMNSLSQVKDSTFLAMMQGRPMATKELASDLEVARYLKLVTSAKFVAWRERQEAQLIAGSARTRDISAL
jgi:hypothetical protein